jgi:hypothetical protein
LWICVLRLIAYGLNEVARGYPHSSILIAAPMVGRSDLT